ncbi:MAG: DUF4278 domain-containing protein [Pleurocapsa sp. SU_5_0]|nr:DUF4278 domain-containing protein [Pleurocapsa sp. SU_5_0]NJR63720.1 DUF4278 domain-containing protein [Cyanobacteria bacterium CRU_2_1]
MKLIYRGIVYDRLPSKSVVRPFKTAHNLIYRGVNYSVALNIKQKKFSLSSKPYRRIYRGAAYLVN